jgi:hypothetical protein
MKDGMKYTEAAEERLEMKMRDLREQIEDVIWRKKYIPGDKYVEVTASDIEEVTGYFRIIRPRKSEALKIISAAYFVIGCALVVTGLFFDRLSEILSSEPKRAALLITGAFMVIASMSLVFLTKWREILRRETGKTNTIIRRDVKTTYIEIKPQGKKWIVIVDGAIRESFDLATQALREGSQIARDNRPCRMTTHRADGRIDHEYLYS